MPGLDKKQKFNLKSFIVHEGDANSGHYTTIVNRNNKWFLINDSMVTVLNQEYVDSLLNGTNQDRKTPYILVYNNEDTMKLELPVADTL